MYRLIKIMLPAIAAAALTLSGCSNPVNQQVRHSSPGKRSNKGLTTNHPHSSTSPTAGSAHTSNIGEQASAAWPSVMDALPVTDNIVSTITVAPSGTYRAILYNGASNAQSGGSELAVAVYKFVQGEWYSVAKIHYFSLPPLGSGTSGNSITPTYLVSAKRPSYLITVQGADSAFSGVVGKPAGQPWSKIYFMTPAIPGQPGGQSFASSIDNAKLADGGSEVQEETNNCSPDCAQGTYYLVTYTYSGVDSAFISLYPAVVANNTYP